MGIRILGIGKEEELSPTRIKAVVIFQWCLYYLSTFIFLFSLPYILRVILKKEWKSLTPAVNNFGAKALDSFNIKTEFINQSKVDLKQNQYIIVSNHRSWFDQIAVCKHFPSMVHFLMNEKYNRIPIFKQAVSLVESIPVSNMGLKDEVKIKLEQYIQNGDNVLFFAEGTRGRGKQLLPFKPGAFSYAAKAGVAILPMYILGAEACLSKHKSLLSVKAGKITIIVGEPCSISTNNLAKDMHDFEENYKSNYYEFFRRYATLD